MFFSQINVGQLLAPLEILMNKIYLKNIPIHIHNFEHSRVIMNMKLSSHGFLFHRNINRRENKAQIPSFCMNYCINAAWHGGNQPVALLRCNEAQVALTAAFRSSALLGLVSLIFLLTIPQILYGVQVRWACWPIKHSNTMVIEPAFGTFGSVDRCQVLLDNEINISIKLVSRRKH